MQGQPVDTSFMPTIATSGSSSMAAMQETLGKFRGQNATVSDPTQLGDTTDTMTQVFPGSSYENYSQNPETLRQIQGQRIESARQAAVQIFNAEQMKNLREVQDLRQQIIQMTQKGARAEERQAERMSALQQAPTQEAAGVSHTSYYKTLLDGLVHWAKTHQADTWQAMFQKRQTSASGLVMGLARGDNQQSVFGIDGKATDGYGP